MEFFQNSQGLFVLFFVLSLCGVGFFLWKRAQPKIDLGEEKLQMLKDKDDSSSFPQPSSTGLFLGLMQTRERVWKTLAGFFHEGGKKDQALWDDVEDLLYSSDMGVVVVETLLTKMKANFEKIQTSGEDPGRQILNLAKEEITSVMGGLGKAPFLNWIEQVRQQSEGQSYAGPHVVMIVGVNGVGKTTTVGKLASHLSSMGKKVVVGACDTFRAAAVEQLKVWCERSPGVEMVVSLQHQDPSASAFEAVKRAKELSADVCLLDTAGRLHNNSNLMEELKKLKRVIQKFDSSYPHHAVLVLDAVTGQNALKQALEFHGAITLTDLIVTKCDGSSKGGSVIGIASDLKVPVAFLGVGESVEDLRPFELENYVDALLG